MNVNTNGTEISVLEEFRMEIAEHASQDLQLLLQIFEDKKLITLHKRQQINNVVALCNEIQDLKNGLRIEIAGQNHKSDLLEFLLQFFRVQEPITRSVETTREDAEEFYLDLMNAGYNTPHVSYVVMHNEKLIGCRLNEMVVYDPKSCEKELPSYDKPAAQKIALFINALEESLHTKLKIDGIRVFKSLHDGAKSGKLMALPLY